MRDEALTRAIKAAGSVSALARLVGMKNPQAISQWRRVPPERVPAIEAATGIPRHVLRPDLWDPPASSEAAQHG